MNKQVSFSIVFEGKAVEGGLIGVNELAPALLSLNDLLIESNAILGNDLRISLNLRALSKGSFEADLVVVAKNILKDLVNIFNSNEITALLNLLNVLGIGTGAYVGLIKLLKLLKGRKVNSIQVTQENENCVIFILEDGEKIKAQPGTEKLYQNRKVRESLKKFLKPVESEGIDSIKIKREDDITEILKGEEKYFDLPEEEKEVLLDDTIEKVFQIINLWFKPDNKWKLFDGENIFNVVISDEEFLKRIDRNDEAFKKGSLLKVKLRIYQYRKGIDLHTEYEVIKVLEHIKPPNQLSLNINGNS